MSKSIFISCVHEDMKWVNILKEWANKGYLGNAVIIDAMSEDKRQKGVNEVKEYIKNRLKGSAIVAVLVGKDTHNHDWITAEVELANSFHIKVICIRIPFSTGGKPKILDNFTEIALEIPLLKSNVE